MKFKADRATLMKSLAHVQNVVEKRNTIPILANVLLAVRDGKLTIAATDLEIALVEEVKAETSRNGAITVPAATLYEIVRRQPDNAVIELDHPGGDAQLALRAGRYATSLVALSVDEFPKLDAGKLSHHFVLSGQELRGLIDRTRFAISTEETRYYLNGIFLHAAEGESGPVLRAVATDGHRLARVEEPLAGRCRRHARRHHPAQNRHRAAQAARRGFRRNRNRFVGNAHPVHHRHACA